MSEQPQLTIAGDTDLAGAMARHALATGTAESVYLWRDPADPLRSTAPVFVMAEEQQRSEFSGIALDVGASTVSLPIPAPDDDLMKAVSDGRLKQISVHHGNPTLVRLRSDCLDGRVGRRYGVFAAHRIPSNHGDYVNESMCDLAAYVVSIVGLPVTSIRATNAAFGGQGIDAWFVLARFEDGTIATIEVGAVLPETEFPNGDLQIEVTGSQAVLRAEPEKQAVTVQTRDGLLTHPWYADAAGPMLDYCVRSLELSDIAIQLGIAELLRSIEKAAGSDEMISVG